MTSRAKQEYKRYLVQRLLRHTQLHNCNHVWKVLSESPSQAQSFPLCKILFSTIVVTFYKIQQQLHSSKLQLANPPPPPPPLTSWLVKCSIHRVRNFKCIFLKSLILSQLTSWGTLYFKEYSREIPETQDNQRPIMSWCNNLKTL